jgi:hypothetical protein
MAAGTEADPSWIAAMLDCAWLRPLARLALAAPLAHRT